uniref:Uncharacterized protein n=1 Tax=Papio anubis TaxID=9555 RepID=A0A8I5RA82_PAPAN
MTQLEGAIYEPGSRPSPVSVSASTLILDFQPPELISVLCSATSLAMLEDHPKVSKLATGDWMLTVKPKSITVPVEIPSSPLGEYSIHVLEVSGSEGFLHTAPWEPKAG